MLSTDWHITLWTVLSKIGDAFSLAMHLKTNVFLIVGDPFLRAEKIKVLTAELEKKSGEPFTRQAFDLEESSLDAILTAARTLPFFSTRQVISAKNAGSLKEMDLAVLAAYLENPASGTTLILESDELKSSSELQKLMKLKGQLILLDKDGARGAGATFIQQKLIQYHKTMTSSAKARILAMCGDAMVFLDTMIERLAQFAGDRQEIDEDMVNRFEENWSEMDVFKLTNALVDREPARALKVFRDLMEFAGTDFFSLVGILHWQLRQLWQAAQLLTAGITEREIGSKLRMPPNRLSALRRFSVTQLESAVEALYQIDRKSKTGQMEGIAGLEAWLLEYAAS